MNNVAVGPGMLVSLTYTIADEQGQVLEQSDLPVSYIFGGATELIGGLDAAVAGHVAGDLVELFVPPSAAFGDHDPSLTYTDDIDNVPPQFRHLGAEVPMQNDAGEVRSFYVTRIEDGRLTVDGNHPMAGKTLKVRVRIHEVRPATEADRANDLAGPSGNRLH